MTVADVAFLLQKGMDFLFKELNVTGIRCFDNVIASRPHLPRCDMTDENHCNKQTACGLLHDKVSSITIHRGSFARAFNVYANFDCSRWNHPLSIEIGFQSNDTDENSPTVFPNRACRLWGSERLFYDPRKLMTDGRSSAQSNFAFRLY